MKKRTRRLLTGLCSFGLLIPLGLNACAPMTTHANADSNSESPYVQSLIAKLLQPPKINSSDSGYASGIVHFSNDDDWAWQAEPLKKKPQANRPRVNKPKVNPKPAKQPGFKKPKHTIVNHKKVRPKQIPQKPVTPTTFNDGYHNGHWWQNGKRLYYDYPFAGTDINHYKMADNSEQNTTKMPKFHQVGGFYRTYYGRGAQSINMSPSGKYAFVTFTSDYHPGWIHVVRFNLSNGWVKEGPWFYGGHGQAVAYNMATDKIWCLERADNGSGDDNAGPITKGYYVELNAESMKPIYRHWFDMQGEWLGDNLAFDDNGNAFNAEKVYKSTMNHKQFAWESSVFYKGEISEHGSEWERLEGIHHGGGEVCQGIAFNPLNGKVYEQSSMGSNSIISVNAKKLEHNSATPNDVHKMRMRDQGDEPEGMSFDDRGNAYVLLQNGRTGYIKIMKSNAKFGNRM